MPLSQCWGDGTIKDETKCQALCVHPRAAQNLPARPPQMALPSQLSLYDQALRDVFLIFFFPLLSAFFPPTGEGNGSLNEKINPWPCVLFLSLTSVHKHVNGTVLMHKKYKKVFRLKHWEIMFIHQGTASVVDFFFLYTQGKNHIFLPGILYEFAKVGVVDFFLCLWLMHTVMYVL